MDSPFTNLYSRGVAGDWLYNNSRFFRSIYDQAEAMFGKTQAVNTQNSLKAQIDYEQYLAEGNRRALEDWHRNVPNREIAYPELSYAGQIARANTSIARAGFDYGTADANYKGNLAYRAAGLYGIGSRLSRTL